MIEGLKKDKNGDHKGAFESYSLASGQGSVAGLFNCVNCYIYGLGQGQDVERGLSLFKGHRDVDEFERLIVKLFTNSEYSSCKVLDLSSLFICSLFYLNTISVLFYREEAWG